MKHPYIIKKVILSTIAGEKIEMEAETNRLFFENKESIKEKILRKFNNDKDFGRFVKCELITNWV